MTRRDFIPAAFLLAAQPMIFAATKLQSPKGAELTASFEKVTVAAAVAPPPPPAVVQPGFRITSIVINNQFHTATLTWQEEEGPFIVWHWLNPGWEMAAHTPPTFDHQAIVPIEGPYNFFQVQARAYKMFCQTDKDAQPRIAWTLFPPHT